jgi:hypothetical protein
VPMSEVACPGDLRVVQIGVDYPMCSCSCALLSVPFRAPMHNGEVRGWATSRW